MKAGNDTEWTLTIKVTIFHNQEYSGYVITAIRDIVTYSTYYMIQRHNRIQQRDVEAIVKHRKIKEENIAQNKVIKFEDSYEELRKIKAINFSQLGPDIYFWI
jgi:hypothetical protein